MTSLVQNAAFSPHTAWLLTLLAAALVCLGFVLLVVRRYKRCPSNRILVIYGKVSRGQSARCLHGGGAFVWPLIQDHAWLSLDPLQIEIPLRGALSAENIRVNVPSVFTVAVGTEPDVMQTAAIRLLELDTRQVMKQAEDIILGQLRQVIASMTIEDINRDRDKFLEAIQLSLAPELEKIGLVLINVNITDITDESGYIEAIGRKAASQAVQQAEIDVADQEKHGGIGVAGARREMRVRVAEAEAEAVSGENLSKARVAEVDATLKVKQAEAYQLAETRRREADAAIREAQYLAEARAAEAMAAKIEKEQRAELEARAKAEKAKQIVDAEAHAEQVRIEAEAKAAADFAVLEARARGEYEILARKAEGLRQIVDSCGGAQQAFQMLMLEQLPRLSETAAKAISGIKFDKVVVWDGGAGNGRGATASFLQNLAHALPPMLHMMKDVGGVEMPEFFGRLVDAAGTRNGGDERPRGDGTLEPAAEEGTGR